MKYIWESIGNRMAERSFKNSLEGLFQTYLIEAEMRKRQRGKYDAPHRYRIAGMDMDRLQRRKVARQDGMRCLGRLESQIRKRPPLEDIAYGLYHLRARYQSQALMACLARPRLITDTGRQFIDMVDKYAANFDRIRALETRINDLERRLDRSESCDVQRGVKGPSYPAGMTDEIVKQYATNYSTSLASVAKSMSSRYGKAISPDSIRRIARQRLGQVSRRDRSAERAYIRYQRT